MSPPEADRLFVPALLLSTALVSACHAPTRTRATPVQVAAAADLSLAFPELGKLYEARVGQAVSFSFAASGVLAQQLSQGAPFDLFAAASPTFVDGVIASGDCDGASKSVYARGHVVVWTQKGEKSLRTLDELTSPAIKHIAIANPEHAPYGKAAREALTRAGLWDAVASKIVQAENVRQALQFAQTGNADAAFVARSLVVGDDSGTSLAIDPALYGALEQTLVVCHRGKNLEGARAFARFVESPEGQSVLARFGFGSVDERRQ